MAEAERQTLVSPYLSRRHESRKPSVRSRGGIVVSQNRLASEIGARVLKEGGHAVDAAVATAMAIGVVEPWMSGIGGVGAMLVRDGKSGKVSCFDFGPVSPGAIDPANYPVVKGKDSDLFGWPMVEGNRNTTGATAVCPPTMAHGLARAHATFGRKDWRGLLAPAVDLAEYGLVVDWNTMMMIASAQSDLAKDKGARERFLPNGTIPTPPLAASGGGNLKLAMPALAKSLRALAEDGVATMTNGPLARALVADIKSLGGCVTLDDMKKTEVRTPDPLKIEHAGHTIHVLPELNGGPTLAMAFRSLDAKKRKARTTPGPDTWVAYAGALRDAWAHRLKDMGDAGDRTAPTCTTHISIVDRDGNMVALTQTILSLFGARIVLPKTGILMNNGINWFNPAGGPNGLAPSRRALANYAPAIMSGDGTQMAVGGCGGRKIIPAVFQLLALVSEFGIDLDTAFAMPRVDVSGGPVVAVDRRLDARSRAALAEAFPTIEAEPVPYPFPFTVAGAVRRERSRNEGAADPNHPWAEAVAEDER